MGVKLADSFDCHATIEIGEERNQRNDCCQGTRYGENPRRNAKKVFPTRRLRCRLLLYPCLMVVFQGLPQCGTVHFSSCSVHQFSSLLEIHRSFDRPLFVERNVRLTELGFHFAHDGLPNAKGLGGGGNFAELPFNV